MTKFKQRKLQEVENATFRADQIGYHLSKAFPALGKKILAGHNLLRFFFENIPFDL